MTMFETESPWSSAERAVDAYGETLPAEAGGSGWGERDTETAVFEAAMAESPYASSIAEGGDAASRYGESPYGGAGYGENAYGETGYGERTYGESPYRESPYGETEYGQQLTERGEWTGASESGPTYELESPFLSAASFAEALPAERWGDGPSELETPFLTAAGPSAAGEAEAATFAEVLAELEDEQFDGAVARLVDHAAALQMASEPSWSSAEAAPAMSMAELERWIQPLAAESDRMLATMSERLVNEELETLRDSELEALLESMRPQTGVLPAEFEDFLGGLFSKAASVVKGAVNLAKKGIAAVGRVLPIGWILQKLRGLVAPLLRQVLHRALGRLPVSLQPVARRVADKLLGEGEASEAFELEAGDLARQFDVHAAQLLFAADEQEGEHLVAEVEAESRATTNALSELDAARSRFAQQVTELPAGTAPVAELEQFIPAIMAVLPVVRLGISAVGRSKVVGFLAEKVAGLMQGVVGADAARQLAGPIVDVGLRMLNLEAPAEAETTLAGEALALTVEDTVRHLLELPAEAFDDGLRLEAEIQQAFSEAAARHIPAERLRPDLPELESLAGGTWILMPRAAAPAYRYKKFSRIFVVPLTRQVARALPTVDGGTVETMLLDRGVRAWPAEAEVHLYETLPGTSLGHIGQSESGGQEAAGEVAGELQVLTPEAAALLVREPGLGRVPLHHHHHRHHHPGLGEPQPPADGPLVSAPASAPVATAVPGAPVARPVPPGLRLYRINVPGAPATAGRPRHRIRVRIEPSARPPALRVHVHLSEREGQEVAAKLQRRDLPGAFLLMRRAFHHVAPAVLTARLLRHGARLTGAPVRSDLAVRLSLLMTEAMAQALSAATVANQGDISRAVQNVQQGITLGFVFRAERTAWARGRVTRPVVTVRPGWHG